jgi:hypothetical protein
MLHIAQVCLIALTYKRKILLKRLEDMHNIINVNTWSFITVEASGSQSGENIIMREVEKITSIPLSSVNLLFGVAGVKKHNLYHAGLTDKEVNDIKRIEGQDLQFFTMREIEKLTLSQSSDMVFSRSKSLIEASFIN